MSRIGKSKTLLTSIAVASAAVLVFTTAVGIGVAMLNREAIELTASSQGTKELAPASVKSTTTSDQEVLSLIVDVTRVGSVSSSSNSNLVSSRVESSANSVVATTPSSSSAAGTASTSSSTSAGTVSAGSSSAVSTVSPSNNAVSSATSGFDAATLGTSGVTNIPSYKQINSDVKGWIKIPNTNINYPVLQSAPGYDAHYYLNRDLYRNNSRDGVIYAGSTAIFNSGKNGLSRNTVLFGHNWTNYSANPNIGLASDVMFAQLAAYHHLSFAQKTPYIWFSTENTEMAWVVFAAFYTDINFNYINPNPTDTEFASVISGAKARSRHIYDVDVTTSDKIITLSTCTRAYGSSDRQRFVVMARQMRAGETFKSISITSNPNPVLPVL